MSQQEVRGFKVILRFACAVLCLAFILSLPSKCMSQVPYFSPYPYFYPVLPVFAPVPPPFFVPPFIDPVLAASLPVPVTRVPAATTIIITNPTTGVVSVTTVAPPAATATATVSPIVTGLVSLYAQALYSPAAISTANPLLFAVLSNLFI